MRTWTLICELLASVKILGTKCLIWLIQCDIVTHSIQGTGCPQTIHWTTLWVIAWCLLVCHVPDRVISMYQSLPDQTDNTDLMLSRLSYRTDHHMPPCLPEWTPRKCVFDVTSNWSSQVTAHVRSSTKLKLQFALIFYHRHTRTCKHISCSI